MFRNWPSMTTPTLGASQTTESSFLAKVWQFPKYWFLTYTSSKNMQYSLELTRIMDPYLLQLCWVCTCSSLEYYCFWALIVNPHPQLPNTQKQRYTPSLLFIDYVSYDEFRPGSQLVFLSRHSSIRERTCFSFLSSFISFNISLLSIFPFLLSFPLSFAFPSFFPCCLLFSSHPKVPDGSSSIRYGK